MVTGEAAALRYDCCAETFLEAACLSMNSQKSRLRNAQLFNRNQSFLVPVLDYSRASCTRSAGQG